MLRLTYLQGGAGGGNRNRHGAPRSDAHVRAGRDRRCGGALCPDGDRTGGNPGWCLVEARRVNGAYYGVSAGDSVDQPRDALVIRSCNSGGELLRLSEPQCYRNRRNRELHGPYCDGTIGSESSQVQRKNGECDEGEWGGLHAPNVTRCLEETQCHKRPFGYH